MKFVFAFLLWSLVYQESKIYTFAEEEPVFGSVSAEDRLRTEFRKKKLTSKKPLIEMVVSEKGKLEYGRCVNCSPSDSIKVLKVFEGMPSWQKPAYYHSRPIRLKIRLFVSL